MKKTKSIKITARLICITAVMAMITVFLRPSAADTTVTEWTDSATTLSTTGVTGIITLDIGGNQQAVTWGTSPFLVGGSTINLNPNVGDPYALNFLNPVALGGARIINVGSTVSGAVVTLSGNIGGFGSTLTKNGVGTLSLTGSNSYSGITYLNYGSLVINSMAAIGSTSQIRFGDTYGDKSLVFNPGSAGSINYNKSTVLGYSYSGEVRSLTGNNYFSTSLHNNDDGFRLRIDSGSTLTLNGLIYFYGDEWEGDDWSGIVTKVGSGTLKMGATNRFLTGIGQGGYGWDDVPRVVVADGTFDLNGYSQYIYYFTMTGGKVINSGGAAALTAGHIYLTGGILQADIGTTPFTFGGAGYGVYQGAGDFTRALGTGASQFRWYLGSGGFAAYGSPLTVNIGGAGAAMNWASTASFIGLNYSLILGSATATDTVTFVNPIGIGTAIRSISVNYNSSSENSYYSVISGNITGTTGGITKYGWGTLVLTGSNSYTGATTITAGALRAEQGTALPDASRLILQGGVFESSGSFTRTLGTAAGNVNWAGYGGFSAYGGNLTVNLGGAGAGVDWAAGNFVPDASPLMLGSITANAVVDFTNPINLNGGVRGIAVTDNPYSDDDYAIISGVISGAGISGFAKTGAGLLKLTNNNTYAGNTEVMEGSLWVTGSIANGTVTVYDGAVLKGTGSVFNAVVQSGGTIAPGNSPGTIYVDGDLTLNTGSIYEWEVSEAAYDKTVVSGNLTLQDGWIFKVIPFDAWIPSTADTFQIFTFGTVTYADPVVDLTLALAAGWDVSGFTIYQQGNSIYISGLGNPVGPVPEPAAIGLIGIALLALKRRRRRV